MVARCGSTSYKVAFHRRLTSPETEVRAERAAVGLAFTGGSCWWSWELVDHTSPCLSEWEVRSPEGRDNRVNYERVLVWLIKSCPRFTFAVR